MDPLKDQPQIITTTICPTRSVLTVADGPGRRIEIEVRSANTTCSPRRGAHASVEDVAVLVFPVVSVQRGGQCPRGHGVFHQGEAAAGFRAVDHKPDADRAEPPGRAVAGSEDPCARGYHGLPLR
jgi:hypothetical protein